MKFPKQFLRVVALTGAAMLVFASPVQADILLEFDDLIFGAEGSVRTVAEADVSADLVGRVCQISVIAENQSSVHPGNDLIVSTGESQAIVVGVEDEANGGTTEIYQVVVGPSIVVQLRFGRDEMSSLGFGLSFDCEQPFTNTVVPGLDGQQVSGDASTSTSTVETSTSTSTGETSTPSTTVVAPTSAASSSASCSDEASVTGSSTGPNAASNATSSPDSNVASAPDSTQCPADNCSADAAASESSGSTAANVDSSAAGSTACPEPASVEASNEVPSTTVAPPPTTVTASTAPPAGAAATAALPQSPAATAIVAAPAYAG